MTYPIDDSQRRAAKIVGIAYLFAMATSMVAEGYIRGTLIDYQNAGVTAKNIMDNVLLFRTGVVLELLTFVSDSILIASLYVILAPVHRHMSLVAAFLRLIAVGLSVAMAAGSLDVLRVLSGAEYMQAFEIEKVQALARMGVGSHGTMYTVAFIFLGFGSAVFAYVWLKSRYIPRFLAMLGIVASLFLAIGSVAFVFSPKFWTFIDPFHMVPMFFFEVGTGVWLIVKGIRS